VVIQSGSTANQNVTLFGSGTATDKVITVDDDGSETFSVNAGGKAIATDAEISATGRTLTASSVPRFDEIISSISALASDAASGTMAIGAFRAWSKAQTASATSEAVTFAHLGEIGAGNQSLAGAPTGTYLVLGWGQDSPNSANETAAGAKSVVVSHTQGDATSCFTIDSEVGVFGFVVRLT
jgi:hypothetical protein